MRRIHSIRTWYILDFLDVASIKELCLAHLRRARSLRAENRLRGVAVFCRKMLRILTV